MNLRPPFIAGAIALLSLIAHQPASAQLGGLGNPLTVERKLHVVRPNPAFPGQVLLGTIKSLLSSLGAVVYAEIDDDASPSPLTAVSARLTAADLAALQLEPSVIVSEEIFLAADGTNPNPGWALTRITGKFSSPYTYPETTIPVRLYLIDTAVANTGGWIDANPKLTLESSVLVRGSGDPETSSSFKHGTQMLSLIGGVDTGASPGTPIRVVNYDIYPNGSSTTTTLLAKAVLEAVSHHKQSAGGMRSAICIATSSTSPGSSFTLRSAIERAVSEGITVFVSAGNLGQDAGQYIPAAYGSMQGVICTAATDAQDARLSLSNHGSAVDLMAPGLVIRTVADSPGFTDMTGTSPACALSAAIGLTEISRSPALSPAQTEQTLLSAAFPSPAGYLLRAIDAPRLDATLDSDADEQPDLIEIFHGSDPGNAGSSPAAPQIRIAQGGTQISYSFPVNGSLYDPESPQTLRNGISWKAECSGNLVSWEPATATVVTTPEVDGIIWVTAHMPTHRSALYVRLAIMPPS